MPADLFYFISSLPALRWGEKPLISHRDFVTACQEQLGPELAARFEQLGLLPGGQSASAVLDEWEDWETYLRNVVAELRAAKLRKNAAAWLRPGKGLYPGDRKRIEDALNQATPRDREKALDQLRWQQLEHLAAKHQFDLAAIELYTLKLLLCEKQVSRSLDEGGKAYQRLVDRGISQAKEQQGATQA